MVKNYYYLLAGLLSIIFFIAHVWNGQTTILPALHIDALNADKKTLFIYILHIITAENMLFGVAFLFMSVHKDLSKVRFTAWTIAILMIARWIVILGSTIFYNAGGFENTWKESIAFMVFISIIVLGIRVKNIPIRFQKTL
jgi:hypothetical protein